MNLLTLVALPAALAASGDATGGYVSLPLNASNREWPTQRQQCKTGARDLLAIDQTFRGAVVQICNLFGAEGNCYVNDIWPNLAVTDCSTQALEIPAGTCGLFPIRTYTRTGSRGSYEYTPDPTKYSSALPGTSWGISSSSSNGVTKYEYNGGAGAAAVTCEYKVAGATAEDPLVTRFAEPADIQINADGSVSDSTLKLDFVRFGKAGEDLKTTFLTRAGDYIMASNQKAPVTKDGGEAPAFSYGYLPDGSNGNNYGPVASPADTDEQLAWMMAGATGEWLYYNLCNMLFYSNNLLATFTKDLTAAQRTVANPAPSTTTDLTLSGAKPTSCKTVYKNNDAMGDPRKIAVTAGTVGIAKTITSQVIVPGPGVLAPGEDNADGSLPTGAWNSYGVVLFCMDFARVNLNACPEEKIKMFYVAEPNYHATYASHAGIFTDPSLALTSAAWDTSSASTNAAGGDGTKKEDDASSANQLSLAGVLASTLLLLGYQLA